MTDRLIYRCRTDTVRRRVRLLRFRFSFKFSFLDFFLVPFFPFSTQDLYAVHVRNPFLTEIPPFVGDWHFTKERKEGMSRRAWRGLCKP